MAAPIHPRGPLPVFPQVIEEIDLLHRKEVEVAFNVSTQTVQNWMLLRGLPHVILKGGKQHATRFRIKDLQKWAIVHKKKFIVPPKVRQMAEETQEV